MTAEFNKGAIEKPRWFEMRGQCAVTVVANLSHLSIDAKHSRQAEDNSSSYLG
jgi:hypothetical protein